MQEIRSKKVLDDLSILNSPKTRVIREGSKKEIPAEELVMDDIVELSAGGQIPADAVVSVSYTHLDVYKRQSMHWLRLHYLYHFPY